MQYWNTYTYDESYRRAARLLEEILIEGPAANMPPEPPLPLQEKAYSLELYGRGAEVPAMFTKVARHYMVQMIDAGNKLMYALTEHERRYGRALDADFTDIGAHLDGLRWQLDYVGSRYVQRKRPTVANEPPRKVQKVHNDRKNPVAKSAGFPAGLPVEILQKILRSLESPDLARAARVNHDWHVAVILHSDLLHKPEFTVSRPSSVANYFTTCKKYGITHITKITFRKVVESQALLKTLIASGMQIESIDIAVDEGSKPMFSSPKLFNTKKGNPFENLHTFSSEYISTQEDFGSFVKILPALRNLSLTISSPEGIDSSLHKPVSFPKLDELLLNVAEDSYGISPEFLQKCEFHNCRKLTLMGTEVDCDTLERIFHQTNPQEVGIWDSEISYQTVLQAMTKAGARPASLEVGLRLAYDEYNFRHMRSAPGPVLPSLTKLCLNDCVEQPLKTLTETMMAKPRNLRTLVIEHSLKKARDNPYITILTTCPQLEVLEIRPDSGSTNADDTDCTRLGLALKRVHSKLKFLGLACDNVTDAGIRSLFNGHSMPEMELKLYKGSFQEETIQYLRSHCARVKYGQRNYYGTDIMKVA